MLVKYRAQIYGPRAGALMDGSWCFLDPPDRSVFNGGGGGVRNGMFSGGPLISTWQESIGSESHRLLLSDIPVTP
jgi:hypothetical protein